MGWATATILGGQEDWGKEEGEAVAMGEHSDFNMLPPGAGEPAEGGGEVILGPKETGSASAYAVTRDPAGAVPALYQVGS